MKNPSAVALGKLRQKKARLTKEQAKTMALKRWEAQKVKLTQSDTQSAT